MSNTNENPHSSETPIIYNGKNGILSIEDSFSNTGSYCCFHSANDYNDCDEFIETLSVCIENHSVCSINGNNSDIAEASGIDEKAVCI